MPLECEVIADVQVDTQLKEVLPRLIDRSQDIEPTIPKGAWSITVRLTDDETISRMHDEYFGDPCPTDVISFPSGEDTDAVAGHLGDIVISVNTAREQAVDAGHSTNREIAYLALHGVLHLCGGYDDRNDDERTRMLRRQTELLSQLESRLDVSL
jgi:probable rRNA maturation factor